MNFGILGGTLVLGRANLENNMGTNDVTLQEAITDEVSLPDGGAALGSESGCLLSSRRPKESHAG